MILSVIKKKMEKSKNENEEKTKIEEKLNTDIQEEKE